MHGLNLRDLGPIGATARSPAIYGSLCLQADSSRGFQQLPFESKAGSPAEMRRLNREERKLTKRQARTLMALGVAIIITQILCTAMLLRSLERSRGSATIAAVSSTDAIETPAVAAEPAVPPTLSDATEAAPAPAVPSTPPACQAPEGVIGDHEKFEITTSDDSSSVIVKSHGETMSARSIVIDRQK